jgi:hypothetical protein
MTMVAVAAGSDRGDPILVAGAESSTMIDTYSASAQR